MSTLTTNIKIARFMGGINLPSATSDAAMKVPNIQRNIVMPEHLEYHSSWDALVPVLKKCCDIAADREDDSQMDLIDGITSLNITMVHEAVSKFIDLIGQPDK